MHPIACRKGRWHLYHRNCVYQDVVQVGTLGTQRPTPLGTNQKILAAYRGHHNLGQVQVKLR